MISLLCSRTARITGAVALAVLASCATGGSHGAANSTNTAGRITFRDYSTGATLSLISDAMLVRNGVEGDTSAARALTFYSDQRNDANAKVCDNDAIAGLVEMFDLTGVGKNMTFGPAPLQAGSDEKSIEVLLGDSATHMFQPLGRDADPDLKVGFVESLTGFMDVYNLYEGRQNLGGNVEFKKPVLKGNLKGTR